MYTCGLALAGSVMAVAAAICHSWSRRREKAVSGGSGGEGEISGGGWGSGGEGKTSGGGWGGAWSVGEGKTSGGGWGGARSVGEGKTSGGGWGGVGSVGRKLGLSRKTVSGGVKWSWWLIDWFRCRYQFSSIGGEEKKEEESHVILSTSGRSLLLIYP